MTVAAQDYVAAMRHFPAAVNLICAGDGDGRAGMTASAVMSLTAEPAQIGAAVARTASAFPTIDRGGRFVVNTLPAHHMDLARRFAGPVKGAERFAVGPWTQTDWGPVLDDALVSLCCEIERRVELSSHVLFVGTVRQLCCTPGVKPLLYVDGDWASLVSLTPADEIAFRAAVTDSIAAFDAACIPGAGPVERLDRFIRGFTHVHIEKQAVTREYLSAEIYVPAPLLDELNARKRELDRRLIALLEEGRGAGLFRFDDARLTAFALSGMVGWVHRWFRPDGRMPAEAVAAAMAGLALRMLGAATADAPSGHMQSDTGGAPPGPEMAISMGGRS